jgi:pimeloyl-ACP methyl ester carboxylesterase
VFQNVKLEQDMPKRTTKEELKHYKTPTLVMTGTDDIFFPHDKLEPRATELFHHAFEYKQYEMGHFPSDDDIQNMKIDISSFLHK